MTVYINMRAEYSGPVETVDEFETRREAREMLTEYQMAFGSVPLWISTRSTKEWGER